MVHRGGVAEGGPVPMPVAFHSREGRSMCGGKRKGISKMTTAFKFCVIGVATLFLIVGEVCFACATWIAERCYGGTGWRSAGGPAGKKKGVTQ